MPVRPSQQLTDLAPFDLQIVDSVVTINPSYLAKSSTAGTFAKMTIHPSSRTELMSSVEQGDHEDEHRVYERARVDLIRI
jgi:DNA polymerase alpha subunit B